MLRSENVSIDKPQIVFHYITNMGGVDLSDPYAFTFYFLKKKNL